MERAVLETVDLKEIKRLERQIHEMESSIRTLETKIRRDSKNFEHYLGQVPRASSAEEEANIRMDKLYLEKKHHELHALRRQLDIVLGIQNRIAQVESARKDLAAIQDELSTKTAERNRLKAQLGELPTIIQKLDWELNSVLLPRAARLKDALATLEAES